MNKKGIAKTGNAVIYIDPNAQNKKDTAKLFEAMAAFVRHIPDEAVISISIENKDSLKLTWRVPSCQ